jgi:SAM-dependent methyltransferase
MAPASQDQSALMRDDYDELGEEEWHRLARDLPGRVSFEVHRRFLARLVRPGHRVLEVGAGPGRFTTVLADLGARILVTDLSPVQLGLNHTYVGTNRAEEAVETRELLDVCDTSRYDDGEFDVLLAYGGPPVVRVRANGRGAARPAPHPDPCWRGRRLGDVDAGDLAAPPRRRRRSGGRGWRSRKRRSAAHG